MLVRLWRMNRARETSLRYAVPTVAYLLSSYAALLVFCDGIVMRPPPAQTSTWFRYMLLHAGFFSLVHLAFLSFFSERYRSLRKAELTLSSAACGVASAFLFARSLKLAPVLIDRGLIPRIIIAVVVVALLALLALESLRRRSSENGITRTRRTAVLLSSGLSLPRLFGNGARATTRRLSPVCSESID